MNSQHIILIEDDKQTMETLQFVLSRDGFELILAHDGEEGMEAIDQEADLIILDLLLPHHSGFDILEFVRKQRGSKIPVLVLSNLGGHADIDRAMRLGATDYMVKSASSLLEITKKVKKILKDAA
jgi:DNA-binding response OmpR family regulator